MFNLRVTAVFTALYKNTSLFSEEYDFQIREYCYQEYHDQQYHSLLNTQYYNQKHHKSYNIPIKKVRTL